MDNNITTYESIIADVKHNYRKFYLAFPDEKIVNACVHNLNWSHFRSLLRVYDKTARLFMSKYLTYLPSKERLEEEIARQKEIFYMQHPFLKGKSGEANE